MNKTPKLRFKEFSGDWERVKVGKVFSQVRNGFVGTATPYYVDEGVPYLQSNNIRKNKIDKRKIVYINDEFHNKNKKSILKKDDILMVQSGHAGECAVVTEEFENANCHALIVMTPTKNINSTYCSYYINSDIGQKRIYKLITGNTIKHILASEMKEFNIIKPELKEQEKIATFFSLIDDKISLQDEKVEALKDYKKGIMQKIFSRELRFKDDDGRDYPKWNHKKLNSFVERVTRKNKGIQSTLPLTISAQYGLVDQITFFNKTVASSNLEGYYLLEKGEFAYNKSYSTGYPFGAIKRLDNYDKGVLSSLYICFAPLENIDSDFLLQYFETSCWYKEISMIAVEGARNHGLLNISVSDFFETYHWIPSYEEQVKIGKFLCQIDEKVAKEQAKLDSLNEYKKGLLQQMFI
ncbi:restriction endonuclease subunit S [Romboutsia hominis]|uniref:Sau1hsdS1 n=1 Tax=Romboutsia hominis TaxID=1507512 RepID=A0A2P2BQG0_9FIRM|nr:restriction endonuclease subunit S [Romboutsia hominis]CEI72583.1 Sau1hsdS1 [Romboutsia hominis]